MHLMLNAAVNNVLNKDYSDVSLYRAGSGTLYAVITSRQGHRQRVM